MARKPQDWSDLYEKALRKLGIKLTGTETLKTKRKKWKKLRKSYISKGLKAPNLYTTAKEYKEFEFEETLRDDEMRTEPSKEDLDEDLAKDILDKFISDIMEIHSDTLAYIDTYSREGWTHEQGRLANIAKLPRNMEAIQRSYYELVNKYHDLIESGIPKTIIAQAIQDNVELDYIISITLMPPSDIQLEFERTTEQLNAVMAQIEKRAQELAEEAEREYYGK